MQQVRQDYIREGVRQGAFPPMGYEGIAPNVRESWEARFLRALKPVHSAQPRLVNRFKVGADPEFVFGDPNVNGVRADAFEFSFKAGLAFGADQNGRLVEFRPQASRYALETLGSILAELRWMAVLKPMCLPYKWLSGPFTFGDGIGGHIHFGRKRPTRKLEVEALDIFGRWCYDLNVFDRKAWDARQAGDERGQRYGRYGDFRVQTHGYEYRTLPSWLNSPWLAYFCLVMTKLVVHNPELLKSMARHHQLTAADVQKFLAYYKGSDDDARLAYAALVRFGLPRYVAGDFKAAWGIDPTIFAIIGAGTFDKTPIVPPSIAASAEDMEDVFNLLSAGTAVPPRICTNPAWMKHLPKNYFLLSDTTDFLRQAGMGELVSTLVGHHSVPVRIRTTDGLRDIRITRGLLAYMPKDWQVRLKAEAPSFEFKSISTDALAIYVPAFYRDVQRMQQTKRILTNGMFPLWKVRDVTAESFEQWQQKSVKPEPKYCGRVLVDGTL